MRFNLHPEADVILAFNFLDHREITMPERMALYSSLIHDSEILFDKINSVRRVLILKADTTWLCSVVGDTQTNEIFFFEIKEDSIPLQITHIEEAFINDTRHKLYN